MKKILRTRDSWRWLPLACLAIALPLHLHADDESSITALKEKQEKIRKIAADSSQCVVGIMGRHSAGVGSGVIVSEDGLVLTAGHVTAVAGSDLIVVFPDGTEVPARALGRNMDVDAGMVQITKEGRYPHVELGAAAAMDKGSWCVALGHPGGYDVNRTPPLRIGKVLNQGKSGFLTTDCTLNGGDSGGALFDLEGKLIGIHSSIGGSLSINRHVPVEAFRESWDRMKQGQTWGNLSGATMLEDFLPEEPRKKKSARRQSRPDLPPAPPFEVKPGGNKAVLGVGLDEGNNALLVGSIAPRGPAAEAGVKVGDEIRKLDGDRVTRVSDLIDRLEKKSPGDSVMLTIKRGQDYRFIEVTLGAR